MPRVVRARADERASIGQVRGAVSVIDESKIATHDEPAARERSNYIVRLDLTADGLPGHYEQMWTRTDDRQRHELCCIPFFTYGLSLGDVITLTTRMAHTELSPRVGTERSGLPSRIRATPMSGTRISTACWPRSVS
jgi:hypothetical protein